jgi:hypothetical protein
VVPLFSGQRGWGSTLEVALSLLYPTPLLSLPFLPPCGPAPSGVPTVVWLVTAWLCQRSHTSYVVAGFQGADHLSPRITPPYTLGQRRPKVYPDSREGRNRSHFLRRGAEAERAPSLSQSSLEHHIRTNFVDFPRTVLT